MREKYFFSDNGGEFVNETMTNFLHQAGIRLKTTGSLVLSRMELTKGIMDPLTY